MHRYYCEQPIKMDADITIDGSEAHHLLHVMRATAGQQITLFDGGGTEFVAEVRDTWRRIVTVRVLEQIVADYELGLALTIGCALPKGDRQRFLIEKLVELGVSRFVPLRTERSVVKPNEAVCERLRKSVIEASKQCGRNRLMQVIDGKSLAEYLAMDLVAGAECTRLIAHPNVRDEQAENVSPSQQFGDVFSGGVSQGKIALAIGPEGGFTDEEVVLARHHCWQSVSLGPRILRIETAAIALAARFGI